MQPNMTVAFYCWYMLTVQYNTLQSRAMPRDSQLDQQTKKDI